MNTTTRKLLSLLLCLVMMLSLFPAAALAEDGEEPPSFPEEEQDCEHEGESEEEQEPHTGESILEPAQKEDSYDEIFLSDKIAGILFSSLGNYNVSAAVAWAIEHAYDNDGTLCAEFVCNCLSAGGITGIPNYAYYKSTDLSYIGEAFGAYTNPYTCSAPLLKFLSEYYQIISSPAHSDMELGDLVFMNGDGHVGIITGFDGAMPLYSAHNNARQNSPIYNQATFVVKMHDPAQPPTFAELHTNAYSYAVDETVEFSIAANGTRNNLWIYCPDSTTLTYEDVGAYYELAFGMAGHYQALVQTWNSIGSFSSELIDFVVGPPTYATITTDKFSYARDENVTFSFNTDGNSNTLWIYCPNDDTLYYEDVGDSYHLPFGMLGHYHALVQAWNGQGSFTSEMIDFIIGPPTYASIATDKMTYLTNETVTFTCNSDGNKNTIWIYSPDGSSNYYEDIGTNYCLSFTTCGEYQALVQAWNGEGSYTSDRISFTVTTYYTISYNANGGTGAPAAQTKTHDVALTLSTTKPTRSNASAGSYTVTLNANGGNVGTTSLTAARTTSYSFKNWNTAANGSGTSYASGGSYTANAAATLYAQWNSSTSTAAVTLPTPTRSGYSFKGWATSASATSGTTGSYTPTGNVTLYATWEANKYTITYDANGGTGAPAAQTKTHDVALTLSTTQPARADASAGSYTVTLNPNGGSVSTTSLTAARTTSYSFKNWNTKADGSGTSYASGGSYTANAAATLYAQWNSSTSTAAVTLPTPTRTGYSFKGWATSSTATGGSTGSYTPSGNVTLYAIWEANKYTITFNDNGGTGGPGTQIKPHDVALNLSTTQPTRSNASAGSYTVTLNANGGNVSPTSLTAARTTSYSFKNWNTAQNGSGASYAPGASFTTNADTTLYAQWNSSTSTAAVTLPTPTRTGYTFKGWADSASAASGTTGSYTPTSNVTLYAIWEQNAPETDAKLIVDGGRAQIGKEIRVPVRIEKNPGVVSIEISVVYDETVLEWTGVMAGEFGGTFDAAVGSTLTWFAEDPAVNETKDGVFATLTFRAKEDAEAGTTQISVTYDENNIYNADEENQPFQVVPGEIEIMTHTPGDINGDGEVNNKDVIRLRRYLKSHDIEVVEAALDVNGDGSVGNKDVTRLMRYLKYGDVDIF